MIFTFWTADILFHVNNIIIIGWLALIFAPFNRFSKYFVLAPTLFLSVLYTIILFQILFFPSPGSPPVDFFHLSGWLALVKQPFIIVGIANHMCAMDLWVGQWMVYDFYSGYTFAYSITMDSSSTYQIKTAWTFGRIFFTLILLISYLFAPLGFVVYRLAKFTFLKKHKTHHRIDFHNPESFNTKNMIQSQTESLGRRSVRFSDQFPEPLQTIYHFVLGVVGLIVLLTIALPSYIGLRIYCRIVYHSSSYQSSTDSELKPNKYNPEYVRNKTAEMKLTSLTTPPDKRNWIWNLKFLLLQLSTFIEYFLNYKNPVVLFKALEDYFRGEYNVPYYAFGNGIGVSSHELVKRYLQDLPPKKGFESLGWHVSSSLGTFCDFTTIYLSSDNPDTKLGRDIIFRWLHAFPYDLRKNNNEARFYLSRLVPRKIDEQPNEDTVYQAVGEVLFFLATGGELRKHERQAFIDCVKNPSIFFPNWFNFLLGGHYLERKVLNSYYIHLQAFSRYADKPALQAAFKAAGTDKSQLEVLKLVAIVFSIAGNAAPAKLAFTVIDKLWSKEDKEKNVRLFKKNPHNFIKECARLDKVVPMVTVLATKQIANEIEEKFREKNPNISIPHDTPIHCSLVNANRDKKIFQNPDDFLPERADLNKMFVWNGVEEDIMNKDRAKRPIRYCPGHDLSLDVVQYVAEQFLPVISEDNDNHGQEKIRSEETDFSPNSSNNQNDSKKSEEQNPSVKENMNTKSFSSTNYSDEVGKKLMLMNFNINKPLEKDRSCWSVLDYYTKLVIHLMEKAVEDSNSSPSRAIDILQPFNFPDKDLGMLRLGMAKFIPTWDEDEPKGSGLKRQIARWLVNQNIWEFRDSLTEFNTIGQAIEWRSKMFPALPVPNIIYKDMSTDDIMTQLAFSGCACHYTHRLGKEWHAGYGIPEQKYLKNAVYINDMTSLSTFRVRKPFERYGAAAYFDKNFKIIAIYWSHGSRLIRKDEHLWAHAKYVWRSSFFAYVTICDHLIVTHLIECNAFVSASRKCLPVDHPLRKFIKPFTYHTVSVNYQAAVTLVNERGLVHRIWAFEYDEFLKVCDYISMNYKYRPLKEYVHKTMDPETNNDILNEYLHKTMDPETNNDILNEYLHKTIDPKTNKDILEQEWDKIYPIYHDHKEFRKIIERYVATFFKINYNLQLEMDNDTHNKLPDDDSPNDKLPDDSYIKAFINEICKHLGIAGITSLHYFVEVLSKLIASNTGIHEHVGQISDYMIDPRFVGAKLQEGKEIQNIQTYTQILVLSVVTGFRMPGLLEDWSHLIEDDGHDNGNLKNYRDFKRELRELSEDIDNRNKIRNYPFQSFNPKYMECSTSV